MIFDPWYWVVFGLGLVLSLWASARVRLTFRRFRDVPTRRGFSGAEVAERILQAHGVRDVRVEPVAGTLTDHYDPSTRTLRLSEPVFHGRSVAALGVAAHEVGHALQHAHEYGPLQFRSAWVPVANTAGGISMFVILGALLLGGVATPLGALAAWVGLGLFATTTVFTLVTLPVEFDASRRALLTLAEGGHLQADELPGARKVLDAAAMTYVAAFATSLLMLVYWAQTLGLFGGSEE